MDDLIRDRVDDRDRLGHALEDIEPVRGTERSGGQLAVRRQIDRLDMVQALKTRE